MDLPLVSVIIPVYNTGEVANGLIRNILKNSYSNIEIIVVDDGSTDDSVEILNRIRSSRMRIIKKDNGGPSSARNSGISIARGKYLLFIDSDDKVSETYIEKLVKRVEQDDSVLVMTGVRFCSGDEEVKEEFLNDFTRRKKESVETYVLRSLLKDGRMYSAFNKIFDAEIVEKNKIEFDEGMKFGEDTKFVLDYVKEGIKDIVVIKKPLYTHYFGSETSTAKKFEGQWSNWKKCYSNLKKWIDNPTLHQKILLWLIYLRWRYTWLKAR